MSLLNPFSHARSDGRTVRYAVVGAGWIAQEDFLPNVKHTGNSVVTAIVTGDLDKAQQLAKKYDVEHVTGYDGYDELLRSGKIDAIYLALPNAQHRDFTVRALEAGIHVLCEKPMAPTEADCEAMIAASEKGGAKLMIAYRLHFEEGTVAAIKTANDGTLGDVRAFSSVFCQQVSGENSRADSENWAGPLPDMGPYPLNTVRQLFRAEPVEVFAYAVRKAGEKRFTDMDEMVTAVMKFPGDRLAHFTISFGANPAAKYTVVGTEGSLEVDKGYSYTEPHVHEVTVGESSPKTTTYKLRDQFGGETQYFSDCVLDDQAPEPDGWEGLADVRVIKALEESIRTGRPVGVAPLPERPQRPGQGQVRKLGHVKQGELIHAKSPEEG